MEGATVDLDVRYLYYCIAQVVLSAKHVACALCRRMGMGTHCSRHSFQSEVMVMTQGVHQSHGLKGPRV